MKHKQFNALVLVIVLSSMSLLAKANQGADTTIKVTIDFNKTAQTIHNIGASGCWFSEGIGKDWPVAKREKIAQLLFSKKLDKAGNPEGIGLSAWRFNIGAGTAEQGDSAALRILEKGRKAF